MAVSQRQLKVLISSKQAEFTAERADIARIISPLPLLVANVAEEWSPERMPVQHKSVLEAAECAIYVGLFGCVHSEPAVSEYVSAHQNPQREMLIYVKRCAAREPKLAAFVESLEESRSGHTITHFSDWSDVRDRFAGHLWDAIGRMIDRLLRLANPPVAMGSGSILAKKWSAEHAALVAMGLPDDPDHARQLAGELQRARSHHQS